MKKIWCNVGGESYRNHSGVAGGEGGLEHTFLKNYYRKYTCQFMLNTKTEYLFRISKQTTLLNLNSNIIA